MPPDPELDYLEKLFGEAYRKEIEQEENVWRTLPFFAATLALQLAGLAQIRDWVGGSSGELLWFVLILLGVAASATVAALLFLAESIWPANFRYVTPEPDLQDYMEKVRDGAAAAGSTATEAAAVSVLAARAVMVEQYALGAAHNRAINQRRASRRTRAGLATLVSVLAVLVLVALVVIFNLHGHERIGTAAGPDRAGGHAAIPAGPAPSQPGAATADGGGLQGLVERPHDPAPSGGAEAGRPRGVQPGLSRLR